MEQVTIRKATNKLVKGDVVMGFRSAPDRTVDIVTISHGAGHGRSRESVQIVYTDGTRDSFPGGNASVTVVVP